MVNRYFGDKKKLPYKSNLLSACLAWDGHKINQLMMQNTGNYQKFKTKCRVQSGVEY